MAGVEYFDEKIFQNHHPEAYNKLQELLIGVDGHWEFNVYTVLLGPPDIYMVIYHDELNEDRSFTAEWDNAQTPFIKAHIEIDED